MVLWSRYGTDFTDNGRDLWWTTAGRLRLRRPLHTDVCRGAIPRVPGAPRRPGSFNLASRPSSPKPNQPIPVTEPDVVHPPTPIEEPQPDKGYPPAGPGWLHEVKHDGYPDLPQPGPDVVVPPGPEVA